MFNPGLNIENASKLSWTLEGFNILIIALITILALSPSKNDLIMKIEIYMAPLQYGKVFKISCWDENYHFIPSTTMSYLWNMDPFMNWIGMFQAAKSWAQSITGIKTLSPSKPEHLLSHSIPNIKRASSSSITYWIKFSSWNFQNHLIIYEW